RERVRAGVRDDHEPLGAEVGSRAAGRLDHEPRADALPAVRGRRDDDLEPAAAAGHDHAAAPPDVAVPRAERDVPRPAPGPEERPEVVEPPAREDPVVPLVVTLVSGLDLRLEDSSPDVLVHAGRRIERPDDDVAALARMRREPRGDQTDVLR